MISRAGHLNSDPSILAGTQNLTLDRESTCSVKSKNQRNVPSFFKYNVNCAYLISVSMFEGTAIIHIGDPQATD